MRLFQPKSARHDQLTPQRGPSRQGIAVMPPGLAVSAEGANHPAAPVHRKRQAMVDQSSQMLQLKRYQEMVNESPQMQRRSPQQTTGMPEPLKSGLEHLSGRDLSGVRVHYNSSKPAQLNALAYTQGQDIEVGPGQERHLAHEGWHAVQQMQGRVQPTASIQGMGMNDDSALEREADVMGKKALHGGGRTPVGTEMPGQGLWPSRRPGAPLQRQAGDAEPLAQVLSAEEADEFVAAHNQWRANYYSGHQLTWSPALAKSARKAAQKLVKERTVSFKVLTGTRINPAGKLLLDTETVRRRTREPLPAFSGTKGVGENIISIRGMLVTPTDVVNKWGLEVMEYERHGPSEATQRFTQLIWQNTKMVGCAKVRGPEGTEAWVAHYAPPGNYVGELPYSMEGS